LRVKGGKERETLGLRRTGCVRRNVWAGCVGVGILKCSWCAPLFRRGAFAFLGGEKRLGNGFFP
jgi:hypothetical protein